MTSPGPVTTDVRSKADRGTQHHPRGDIVYVSEWLVGAICGSLVTAVALMGLSLVMGTRKGK